MFFTVMQNNSQGVFDYDEKAGIAEFLVIEAPSAREAGERLDDITERYIQGPYCECCGKRWPFYADDDDRGTQTPTIYEKPAETYIGSFTKRGHVTTFIHYLDGRVEAAGRRE
jgi:hypothetical protein